MVSDARLLIFFSMFLCLFLMFSRVLRMARIFWFLQRGLSKKCQRGVLKNTCPFAHPLCIFFANSLVKTSLSGPSGILHYFYFFFLPFSPGDAYNTRFFSGILLIRFFCNFSLRTAGNSLFTAFSPDVDFFKVSFFLFFQDWKSPASGWSLMQGF